MYNERYQTVEQYRTTMALMADETDMAWLTIVMQKNLYEYRNASHT